VIEISRSVQFNKDNVPKPAQNEIDFYEVNVTDTSDEDAPIIT